MEFVADTELETSPEDEDFRVGNVETDDRIELNFSVEDERLDEVVGVVSMSISRSLSFSLASSASLQSISGLPELPQGGCTVRELLHRSNASFQSNITGTFCWNS